VHHFQSLTDYFLRFIKSAGVLTGMAIFLVMCEFSIPLIFYKLFHRAYDGKNLLSLLFILVPTFVFFFIIPLILNQLLYKEKLTELGLAKPCHWGKTLLLMGIALLLLGPCIFFLAHYGPFQIYYFFPKLKLSKLIVMFLVILPLYYFFEEFFFRGFLLSLLYKKVRWHSLWITDLVFTLAHIAKPALEILLALPAGIILALLTFRTKSIYPAIVVHYLLGVIMILSVNPII